MSDTKPVDSQPPAPAPEQPQKSRAGYGYGYGYGYGAAVAAPEVHLLDYVRVLYKRRWTAITAFVVIFLTVGVYTFTATPIYAGRAQILIEPENPNVISFKEVIEQDKSTTDYYQTQYKILQSRLLARKTIDRLKLWNRPELGGAPAGSGLQPGAIIAAPVVWVAGLFKAPKPKPTPEAAETALESKVIDSFVDHLTVSPIRNSRLVEVRFESNDPNQAALITNTLAKCYIEQTLDFKFLSSKEATDWLGEQLAEQRKRVEATEQALQKYREQGDAVALDERQNIVVQGLTEMSAAVTKARTERIGKEELYRRLSSLQTDRTALDTFPAILSNAFIQQQKGQLADLQRQQAQLGEKYGPNHPEMTKLKTAIESTDAKLQGEIGKVVESVRNEYLSARAQEQSLQGALDQKKTEALALGRKGIDYGVLKRENESNTLIYNTLLQRAKETGVSAELKTSNIRVVDAAEVPRGPVRPNKSMNLLLALFGGGLVAAGLAFFFEYLDNRIKSPDEIKAHLGLPFLGLIPAIKAGSYSGPSPVINNGVPANFTEAFRSIRTNVLFSSAEEGARSMVVTSTAPGEGKTLVATNVAMSLAQAGQRVLLVDGDMRRPRVHEVFDVKQEPGLSNIMTGTSKASEAVHKSTIPGLWLLPAGTNPPNPAELIGSHRFRDFLASLGEHFDWVVIDSPPVMVVTDAALVAHRTTGVLFVVGCEMTSRHAAQGALDQLQSAKAKVIGAVLNRVNVERNSYYYSHYYKRAYSNYYRSAEN